MTKHDPDLTAIFQALSDPTRRGMIQRLTLGPAPVTELAQPSGLRLPTILRHLSVLETAGLVETRKEGRTRVCRARPEAMLSAESWLSQVRNEWEDRADRLSAFLRKLRDD
ncbi:metalloregulator ArsR/SmtB family transcription factor [Rhodobacter sp. Har01]|uniref:ArsR/SmtB family transcription factor n=1 Tax=Rhodobacter sp. Har01 TaxID=2883999 RepID=UPI001D07C5F9|nr:metalloregulator ArsR/SmtB family transcription factor [Rhodobacter sp. Har01]MCB6176651.1 metalloregulator ArsR/SmtB family transcription factor [Rhodobacter sp. Har01]